MDRRRFVSLVAAFAVSSLAGLGSCGKDPETTKIRLATTTSFRDTGFADVLLPAFRAETGIQVDSIAVGTGEALKLGERGDADVVLVHARKAEDEFLAKGFGVERRDVWWNRFLILGPEADPAGLRTAAGAADGLARIGAANAAFISRGDDSGTHKREQILRGGSPKGSEYAETGQGQGPSLLIASEKRAYILSDEGTYLRMRDQLAVVPLVAGDKALENPYGVIVVRADARGAARFAAAKRFAAWLTEPKARALVQAFTLSGRRAFFLPGEIPPADAAR